MSLGRLRQQKHMITDEDIEKVQKAQKKGAQIQTTVKVDKTKTNKCSEWEWSRAELVWNNTMQSYQYEIEV